MSSEYLDRRLLCNSDLTANTHMITIAINENICACKNTCLGVRKSECIVYSGVNCHSVNYFFPPNP